MNGLEYKRFVKVLLFYNNINSKYNINFRYNICIKKDFKIKFF